MSSTTDPNSGPPSADPDSPLRGTLPLIVLSVAFFVGAYVAFVVYPHLGPDNFPIWGFLLTMGFVAAIGSTVSWFFATDDVESLRARSDAAETATATPGSARGKRKEFGRPAPDRVRPATLEGPSSGVGAMAARSKATADPWDEDALPPVAPRGPRPLLATPDDPGDIGRALEEIAEIQRQLVTRPTVSRSSDRPPARA